MKRLLLILSMFIVLSACDEFDRFTYMPPPDINTEFTNSNDPDSPNYPQPQATIISGPTNGSTITNTNNVSFAWTGVHTTSKYMYILENYETSWNGPNSTTSVDYNSLNNGTYTFKVLEQEPLGNVQSTATAVTFTINYGVSSDVELVFSEDYVSASQNTDFYLDVVVNNISNLMGANIVIQYNAYYLSVTEASRGSLFGTDSNNIFWYNADNTNGILEIETSVLEQTYGIDGSGTLATIKFHTKQTGNTNITYNQALSVLRDYNNINISLANYGSTNVDVNETIE